MENQIGWFDLLYPNYKISKPIRLIELFAGYGSQALALKYLGVNFEHWKICEWAVKSIQAYRDIHFSNSYYPADVTDIPREMIIDTLYKWGISSNYNEPMTLEQIKRLSDINLYNIYENILVTNNLVNIQQVKGEDLEIVDTDKYDYILTYSFPCQDLSMAGKRKGMSDTSTRSGMLWEVERILKECKELGNLPQILLMENVPQVHSEENKKDFFKWQLELEKLGYKNYVKDLIATDFGIPQTRDRCFMVSILGEYNYNFPKSVPLKLKLKDLLEDDVDEKYYISDDLMQHIQHTGKEHKEYTQYDRYNGEFEQLCRVWKDKSPTLHTKSKDIKIYVKNATKKVNIMCDDLLQNNKIKENDTLLTNFITRRIKENDIIQKNNITPTLTTSATEIGICVKEIQGDLKIRRLTPRECFRLMGVKDEDFDKVAKNQSDNSLYHLAGDSIVVNVLMAIFKEMI